MDGVPAAREYKGGLKVKDMMNHLAAAVGTEHTQRSILPMTTQALELYKQVLCTKPSLTCTFFYGMWRYGESHSSRLCLSLLVNICTKLVRR